MSEPALPDPLETFLKAPPREPISATLRDRLLDDTTALLPRPRGWRRWPIASAVAASIVAAFVAGYFLGRHQEPARQDHVEQVPVPLPKPTPQEEPKPPAVSAQVLTALELEWKAFDTDDGKERTRLYFQAGDLYLARNQDADAALRCYRQALSDCDAGELEVRSEDNWLVTALKLDYRKEK